MKKTMLAVAVLGAFAGSAFAADVTLYGRLDTSVVYTHTKDADGVKTNSASMESGWATGPRWGLKGAEDLGNNVKVGFVLESGFSTDTGAMGQSRLFGRESTLYVASDYGTVYAGRMNTLLSDGGSMGMLGATSAIGNSYGYATMKGSTGAAFARHDNLLGYVSPTFAGLKLAAQYSMKSDSVAVKDTVTQENKANADRYAAFGASYNYGNLNLVLAGDVNIYGHEAGEDVKDGWNVIFGGNYDFEVAKVFAKVAYFKDMRKIADTLGFIDVAHHDKWRFKGYGLELGTNVPVLGGNVFGAVSYRDAKLQNGGEDVEGTKIKRWAGALGYTYAFSKRTNVYTAVNYVQEKAEGEKDQGAQFGVGLVHKF